MSMDEYRLLNSIDETLKDVLLELKKANHLATLSQENKVIEMNEDNFINSLRTQELEKLKKLERMKPAAWR